MIEIAAAIAAAGAAFFVAYVAVYALSRAFQTTPAEEVTRTTAERRRGQLDRLVARFAARLSPHLPPSFVADVKRRITQAGGLSGLTPDRLVIYALGAGLLGLALGVLVVAVSGWSPGWVVAVTLTAACLPFLWLRDRVQERHLSLLHDLPFHLDLLTLSVEAGLDFSAGVQKLVERGKRGPLRDEFNRFLNELRIGKTRAEALEAMATRVGLSQLTSFVSALIQADRLGSGLGRALRAQAELLRHERSQRAETKAGEAPVKMLFPLVLFIFPTIWIILAAPLVYEWVWKGAP